MGVQVISPPITSGSIAAALGFTPAATAISPIPVGTVGAPGAAFEGDTDTGLYQPSDNFLGFSAAGIVAATLGHQNVLGTNDGTVLTLGRTGQTFSSAGAEAYIATINAPSATVTGNGQCVGMNLNRFTLHIGDTTTQSWWNWCGELDYMNVVADAGAVSSTAGFGGWRLRIPGLGADITSAWVAGLGFTVPNDSEFDGTATNGAFIYFHGNGIGYTPTNGWTGLYFPDTMAGGHIRTASSIGGLSLYTDILQIAGSAANIDWKASGKGTGNFRAFGNSGTVELFRSTYVASAVNYINLTPSATLGRPILQFDGTDSDVGGYIYTKGSGALEIRGKSGTSTGGFKVNGSSSTLVNGVQVTPTTTGNTPSISNYGEAVGLIISSSGSMYFNPGGATKLDYGGAHGSAWNFAAQVNGTSNFWALRDSAVAAGGALALQATTASVGFYVGSGAPTVSAAKGSLYLRTDGSTTNDRMYVNTNGSTTWTPVTTAA